MTDQRTIATWYPAPSRRHGHDVRLLGYNTDRKVHVRRLDTGRDFYVSPHELGGMTGGIPALNATLAQLRYIPRKGGTDPGPPQLGDDRLHATSATPPTGLRGGAAAAIDDDMMIDGGLS